jgi:hypothetical protein
MKLGNDKLREPQVTLIILSMQAIVCIVTMLLFFSKLIIQIKVGLMKLCLACSAGGHLTEMLQ